MTSTAPWLSRQRKTDLVEMAEAAGMNNFKNLKKSDLEDAVDNFLRANQTNLQAQPKLADFYKRIKDGSPSASGKELVKSETKTPSKPRRRTIAPKDDIVSDSETPSDPNSLRTPARQSLGVASQIPLPPSPAVVAQEVERQTQRFTAWASKSYARTGAQKHLEWARDKASTSYSVTTIGVALEAFMLFTSLLPWKYLGAATPAVAAFGVPAYDIRAPFFWNLLELHFWSTSTLWSLVSVFIPAAVAYVFNFPLKARRHGSKAAARSDFDAFTFNLTKAVLVWLVFVQNIDLPLLSLKASRFAIEAGVPGGSLWLLSSAGIGAVVALYEAVVRH